MIILSLIKNDPTLILYTLYIIILTMTSINNLFNQPPQYLYNDTSHNYNKLRNITHHLKFILTLCIILALSIAATFSILIILHLICTTDNTCLIQTLTPNSLIHFILISSSASLLTLCISLCLYYNHILNFIKQHLTHKIIAHFTNLIFILAFTFILLLCTSYLILGGIHIFFKISPLNNAQQFLSKWTFLCGILLLLSYLFSSVYIFGPSDEILCSGTRANMIQTFITIFILQFVETFSAMLYVCVMLGWLRPEQLLNGNNFEFIIMLITLGFLIVFSAPILLVLCREDLVKAINSWTMRDSTKAVLRGGLYGVMCVCGLVTFSWYVFLGVNGGYALFGGRVLWNGVSNVLQVAVSVLVFVFLWLVVGVVLVCGVGRRVVRFCGEYRRVRDDDLNEIVTIEESDGSSKDETVL